MFNLDPAKLLIIAVVAVLLLGPDKLPQVARQVGAAWRSVNEFRHRMESEVRTSMPDLPSSADIARLARSPSALLNHLSNMAPDETEGATAGANGAPNGAPEGTPGTNGTNGVAAGVGANDATGISTSSEVPGNESAVTDPHAASPVTGLPIVPPTSTMPPTSTNQSLSVPPSAPRSDVGAPGAGDPSLN